MKTPFITLLLGLAACGDYSYEDLEFLAALPVTADLSSDVPSNGTTSQPLSGGLSRQASGLAGDPSQLYSDTFGSAQKFNGAGEFVIAVIHWIRQQPPSVREEGRRIWGPYPAREQTGFMVRLVMERGSVTGEFNFYVQFKPSGEADSSYFDALIGTFTATRTLREGRGLLVCPLANMRAHGLLTPALDALDEISFSYETDVWPHKVTLGAVGAWWSGLTELHLQTHKHENGSGALDFQLTGNIWGTPNPPLEVFQVTSRWLSTGEGQADVSITSGDNWGAIQKECWDQGFLATYSYASWDLANTSGNESLCPNVTGL
jgi:hypothetical protein